MESLNLEQLGTAGLFIGFLLYLLRMAMDRIDRHEGTIEGLHERNNDNLVTTIDTINNSTKNAERMLDRIDKGRGND